MRALRKALVAALVVAMVLGVAGAASAAVTVAGKPFTDIAGHKFEKNLTMLAALGIMKGDTGTTLVRPDAPITRAEFAIVVVRMLGKESIATALSTYQPAFADAVPTWAWGHVNVAVNMGIIKGYGDGTFKAGNNVTHAEALAMLVRATGHEEGVVGVWPFNYMMAGHELGIMGDVEAFANLPATRGEVAHFAYNALFIDTGKMVKGEYEGDHPSILVKANRLHKGTVTTYNLTDKRITVGTSRDLAATVYIWGATGFPGLMNLPVLAITDGATLAPKILYIEVTDEVAEVTGLVYRRAATRVGKTYLEMTDGNLVQYIAATQYWVNNASVLNQTYLAVYDTLTITKDDLGIAQFVRAFRWTITNKRLGPVASAIKWPSPNIPGDTTEIILDGDRYVVGDTTEIKLNGVPAGLADLKKDDVIDLATFGNTGSQAINIRATRNVLDGTVTAKRQVTDATGTYWKVTVKKADGTSQEVRLVDPLTGPFLGARVSYALDADGYAVFELAMVTDTPYVKVLNWRTAYEGATMKHYVTVDRGGVSVEYECDTAWGTKTGANEIAKIVFHTEGTDAGKLKHEACAFVYKTGTTVEEGTVFSVDATAGVVVLKVEGVLIISDELLTVYAESSTLNPDGSRTGNRRVGAYLGAAGLKAGDEVYFLRIGDGGPFFMLKKFR